MAFSGVQRALWSSSELRLSQEYVLIVHMYMHVRGLVDLLRWGLQGKTQVSREMSCACLDGLAARPNSSDDVLFLVKKPIGASPPWQWVFLIVCTIP
jgi:hypothetical protein